MKIITLVITVILAAAVAVLAVTVFKYYFSGHRLSYEFVTATGGCTIGPVRDSGNGDVVDVYYDVSGRRSIANRSNAVNSSMAIHEIKYKITEKCVIFWFVGGNLSHIYPQRFPLELHLGTRIGEECEFYYADTDGSLHKCSRGRYDPQAKGP